MKDSTVYFIGSFMMLIFLIFTVMFNDENSSEFLCFMNGVAFGWGIISGINMRNQGE